MLLDAKNMDYTALNDAIRQNPHCEIENCLGQRFLGAGMSGKQIAISGIPGNALGAYLNGAEITVHGNAQDAVGDTMNEGRIIIHGNVGDAAGYAMRGGKIFVKGNAGYCGCFGLDVQELLKAPFTVVTPDSTNPYKQMYAAN